MVYPSDKLTSVYSISLYIIQAIEQTDYRPDRLKCLYIRQSIHQTSFTSVCSSRLYCPTKANRSNYNLSCDSKLTGFMFHVVTKLLGLIVLCFWESVHIAVSTKSDEKQRQAAVFAISPSKYCRPPGRSVNVTNEVIETNLFVQDNNDDEDEE